MNDELKKALKYGGAVPILGKKKELLKPSPIETPNLFNEETSHKCKKGSHNREKLSGRIDSQVERMKIVCEELGNNFSDNDIRELFNLKYADSKIDIARVPDRRAKLIEIGFIKLVGTKFDIKRNTTVKAYSKI